MSSLCAACQTPIPAEHVLCQAHYDLLPPLLRQDLYRALRRGRFSQEVEIVVKFAVQQIRFFESQPNQGDINALTRTHD